MEILPCVPKLFNFPSLKDKRYFE